MRLGEVLQPSLTLRALANFPGASGEAGRGEVGPHMCPEQVVHGACRKEGHLVCPGPAGTKGLWSE